MIQAHLLDVGKQQYGDCILLKLGSHTVLIDGGNPSSLRGSQSHDSIPEQLEQLLGTDPMHVDLLIVTHCHNDHIGCLPEMIDGGILTADWALVADPDLGWGNQIGENPIDSGKTIEMQTLFAALREEPMSVHASDDELSEFLLDSQTLRSRYADMLSSLEDAGTEVVRYIGGDETGDLLAEFDGTGMQILGPNQQMLFTCANRINQLGRDFFDFAINNLETDGSRHEIDLYRQTLQATDFNGMDSGGVGAALNCMSLVLLFEVDDVKLLMTGDMQFTAPGIPAPNSIDSPMTALRQRVSAEAPFDLYKIGHHGSDNSFDESLFNELNGTVNYVISTGRKSRSHPDAGVLNVLKENIDDIVWVRTDRNGKCSFDFADDSPSIEIDRGIMTDWRVNHFDSAPQIPQVGTATAPVPATPLNTGLPARSASHAVAKPRQPAQSGRDDVEVITRVPHRKTKVTITIDVDPGDEGVGEAERERDQPPLPLDQVVKALNTKPQLLFVTNQQALSDNIGQAEAAQVLDRVQESSHSLVDVGQAGNDPKVAAQTVRNTIAQSGAPEGVVLLGGYDVVPSAIIDVLPAAMRQQLGANSGDPDNFVVWSDDAYGCIDGDGVAELPVSRIPDGHSVDLLLRVLQSPPPTPGATRHGVRNVKRPFADGVFDILSGDGTMQPSRPAVYTQVPSLSQDFVYLMLHGSYSDATEFHGEQTVGGQAAVRVDNVPNTGSSIVFCGCCWGALIVDKPAVRAANGEVTTSRTDADSIPMKFLAAGANAFVGCTGVHYSPVQSPYKFFGGPMHESFWRHVVAGQPPARALFAAKQEYISNMFHGRDDVIEHAIEYKILRQFTCLGLGW